MRRTVLLVLGVGLLATTGLRPAAAAEPTGSALHPAGGALRSAVSIAPQRVFASLRADAPASVDLRRWTVPVGNQGSVGSCVSWTISYAMTGWYARYQGLSTTATFAPMYSYSQIHSDNSPGGGGTWPAAAYGIGSTQGIDTQADYPQGTLNYTTQPTAAQRASAASYKSGDFSYLYAGVPGAAGVPAIQNAIATAHPVALTMPVYSAFDVLSGSNDHLDADQIVESTYRGSHEVLIVGYDATGVEIQNSWGTGWGNRGFAHLSWSFVEQYSTEATIMNGLVPTTPTAPAVRSTTGTATAATVQWSAPVSTGGSPITGYLVSRDGSGTGPSATTVSAATRSYTFGQLLPGTTYTLTVQAQTALGTGPAAPVTTVTYATGGVRALTAAAAKAAHAATVTWQAPVTSAAITGYRVSRDGTSTAGAGATTTTLGPKARTLTLGKLASGQTYTVTVQPVTAAGAGAPVSVTVRLP